MKFLIDWYDSLPSIGQDVIEFTLVALFYATAMSAIFGVAYFSIMFFTEFLMTLVVFLLLGLMYTIFSMIKFWWKINE